MSVGDRLAPNLQTLNVEFRRLAAVDLEHVLYSDVYFPALKSLRLKGFQYSPIILSISLSGPQLRALDIERVHPINLHKLLVPTLENINLSTVGDAGVQTLSDIVHSHGVFAHRPLAPALRELELQLEEEDLERVLQIGFSDVVLDTLTGCIINGHSEDIELLARALLPGVGPMLVFEHLDSQEIGLRDDSGHTRRLQYWNDNEVQAVWKFFSIRYGLYKTVGEIRIMSPYWADYFASFELHLPIPRRHYIERQNSRWGVMGVLGRRRC
ncbi:hypothetical protein FB451DRAFT_1522674 [Mycena latifolia]|nr:hypothetical protein FB451DRAFT_1522674 [Mycena latifolia]